MTAAMRIAIAAIALLLGLPAFAQVYKWTDSTGKVHYGDRPPEDAKKQELRIRIPSYDGPVEVRDWGAVLRRKAAPGGGSASITMYSTDWCGHCKNARRYFASKGISYRELDVEKSDSGRREYEALGAGGVPLIVVGDKFMRGFSAAAFEALAKGS
jgi:glutaredoxin